MPDSGGRRVREGIRTSQHSREEISSRKTVTHHNILKSRSRQITGIAGGLLVIAAFGAMLVGKADTVLVEHARVLALDLASPVLEAIARPVAVANRTIADLKALGAEGILVTRIERLMP